MRTILKQLGKYKRDSILTLCYAGLEAVMEVILPFTTALIIDKGLQAGDMGAVFRYGLLMIVMALCSLTCGILAGKYAASASAGFACNLRQNMYERIQDFSFSNIDKFSTAGLVTRMTCLLYTSPIPRD